MYRFWSLYVCILPYSRNPSNRNRQEFEEPVQHVDVEPSRIATRQNEVAAAIADDDTITRVASTTLNNNFILVDGRVRFQLKNWIYCDRVTLTTIFSCQNFL